jgi:hypothetical protein
LVALAPKYLNPDVRELREVSMTFQISQRGKEYLRTAQAMLHVAQAMTDRAIAGQLKALADDCQRGAEQDSHADAVKAFARSAVNAEGVRGRFYPFVIARRASKLRLMS